MTVTKPLREPKIIATYGEPGVDTWDADPATEMTAEDHVRWDITFNCALNYSEDFGEIGDGRDLHITVATNNQNYTRRVTPAQLRAHAEHLIGLAERAENRR